MPNETVIVTGSSGLIGAALIDRLGPAYAEIALDRTGPPHPPPESEIVLPCDFSSEEGMREAFAEITRLGRRRIASVIYLAAYYDFSGEPSPLYDEVTVRGTERLLRHLRDFEVEQFVFTSTMLVHQPAPLRGRINEDSPIEPKWDYPKSKAKTEDLILGQRRDMPVVLLRVAGVYDDLCHAVPIAQQIQRIYEKRLVSRVFPGDVRAGQAYVHLDDLVDALVRTIERRAQLPPVTTLLIGEPDTLSYDELQRTIGETLHNEAWETREIPKALAKTGASLQDAVPGKEPFIKPWMIDLADDHYALDINRARQLLGWEPRRSLRETLPAMLRALLADPERWYRENGLNKE